MNRALTLLLAGLIGLAATSLLFGKGSLPHQASLHKQLTGQLQANAGARERNARLLAEVSDLREGLEMVEEKARQELGMVKRHEVLVQYTSRR